MVVNKMKKIWRKSGCIIIVSAIMLRIIFDVIIFANTVIYCFLPEPKILQKLVSPNGEYTAYVYESNGGATTDFIYHLTILNSNKKLNKGAGNTYISKVLFDVEWIDDNNVQVNNYPTINIFKQNKVCGEIMITYKYVLP